MAKKTATDGEKGTKKLPYHTPVLYKFLTNDEDNNDEDSNDDNNDASAAQRDRVHERLRNHLPGGKDYVSGAKVRVGQVRSIGEAEADDSRGVAGTKPPGNECGE